VAFELLNEVHLALFYFTGSYFPFLKRLFCIRYVVDEQTGEGYPRLLFKLVGLSVFLRAIFNEKYRMVLFQRQDREHKDKVKGKAKKQNQMSQCALCLSEMKTPSSIPCGHLFCWDCIMESSLSSNQCPLCREVFKSSRIVPVLCFNSKSNRI
jgi:peroxin-10